MYDYTIESKNPIEFPNICCNCLAEAEKSIAMDVSGPAKLWHFFIPCYDLTLLVKGTNAKTIPLCGRCFGKLIWLRYFSFLFFIFDLAGIILMFVYGNINPEFKDSDLFLYGLVVGLFSLILLPFLYTALKSCVLGVKIEHHENSYTYYFSHPEYIDFLEDNGFIA